MLGGYGDSGYALSGFGAGELPTLSYGTLTVSFDDISLDASGAVDVAASLSVTMADISLSSDGVVYVDGSSAITLAGIIPTIVAVRYINTDTDFALVYDPAPLFEAIS